VIFNKPTTELLLVIAATAIIITGRYAMFGIIDLVFLVIVLCGVNACWDRYFDEEGENNE